MNYLKLIEENKVKQLALIKQKKPFHSNRIYNNELSELINKSYGYKNSFENYMSVNDADEPIPWMTYSSVFYLSQLDISGCDVFEWGAGNSTLYFSERAKTVTTVESDSNWFDYINNVKPANVNLNLVGQDDYAKIIKKINKKYEVISIDGDIFRRLECAYYAVDHINEGGMIIVDNSDWLTNTTGYLREKGFIQIDFAGLGPINNYTWCTSIFFRNSFKIQNLADKQPCFVKGGIRNERD